MFLRRTSDLGLKLVWGLPAIGVLLRYIACPIVAELVLVYALKPLINVVFDVDIRYLMNISLRNSFPSKSLVAIRRVVVLPLQDCQI